MTREASSIGTPIEGDGQHLLEGAVDVHVHACPHINRRRVNALEAAQDALHAGMRAIVLIDIFGVSSGVAGLVEQTLPKDGRFSVLGGIVLNRSVGLINPAAVETAIEYGNRSAFVSLPTLHSRHISESELTARRVTEDLFFVPERITGALGEVLDLIAQHDLVLNTGHISPSEAIRLVHDARLRSIHRILVPALGYPVEVLRELADAGAMLEFTFHSISHASEVPARHIDTLPAPTSRQVPAVVASTIDLIGADHCVVSSDAGSWLLPPPTEALREFLAVLSGLGIATSAIRKMVIDNPTRLFGNRLR